MAPRFAPQNDVERVMLMTEMIEGVARMLLDRDPVIVPLAVVLLGPEANPKSYFPSDHYPDAGPHELLERCVDWLQTLDDADSVVAACACLTLQSREGNLALAVQIETPTGVVASLYPYSEAGLGAPTLLDEPVMIDGLFWDQPSDSTSH